MQAPVGVHAEYEKCCHHHLMLLAQDLSSNGTFVNGRKLKSAQDGAERRWLTAGDRISLVMSVKPLHEQYYIYHTGAP